MSLEQRVSCHVLWHKAAVMEVFTDSFCFWFDVTFYLPPGETNPNTAPLQDGVPGKKTSSTLCTIPCIRHSF